MKKSYCFLLTLLIFIITPSGFSAQTQPQFIANQDYQIIKLTTVLPETADVAPGKIQVLEFFSYGCPWCYRLEPTLEQWLKTKPKNVVFDRVPVIYEPGWDIYAKAYYTAKNLGILNKITPALFDALHKQGLDLSSAEAMQQLFAKHGVSKAEFDSVFNFSPGIGMELNQAKQLMLAYQVFEIPTFVIDGKYKTNILMAKGDDKRLMQIINYLIKQATK